MAQINEYPKINNINDMPYVINLKNQIAHAEKYNKKNIEELKKLLNDFIKLPLMKF